MPVNYVKKSAAPAAVVPSAAPAAPKPIKKALQGHCQPLPFDTADLCKPGRLHIGHLMTLFKVSHSTYYKRAEAGLIPPPDGFDFRRPYWYTSTIAPFFGVKVGGAA